MAIGKIIEGLFLRDCSVSDSNWKWFFSKEKLGLYTNCSFWTHFRTLLYTLQYSLNTNVFSPLITWHYRLRSQFRCNLDSPQWLSYFLPCLSWSVKYYPEKMITTRTSSKMYSQPFESRGCDKSDNGERVNPITRLFIWVQWIHRSSAVIHTLLHLVPLQCVWFK